MSNPVLDTKAGEDGGSGIPWGGRNGGRVAGDFGLPLRTWQLMTGEIINVNEVRVVRMRFAVC